jgi:phosphohistidine phosphatase SixA
MLVLLVRHGHAGTKRHWDGDDSFRPLNEQGLAEAAALADLIAPYSPARIVSSPFLRCVQSVAPLAQAFEIAVERSQDLVPEAGDAATSLALGITSSTPGAVVLCTHGEVIRDVQANLGKGCLGSFGPDGPREKASVWVLERIDGQFVDSTYLPPPGILPKQATVDNTS